MIASPARPRSPRFRRLARAAVCAAPLVVAWAATRLLLSRAVADADAAWEGFVPSPAYLEQRYTREFANEPARALEAAARPLGLALSPREAGRGDGSLATSTEIRSLGAWLKCALEDPASAPLRPEEDAIAWLHANAQPLDDVVHTLLAGDPPRWEPKLVIDAAMIDGHRLARYNLGKTLLARALLLDALGDRAIGRDELLRATTRLDEATWRGPALIDGLLAVALAMHHAGVARVLEEPVPAIASGAPRDAIRTGLAHERWRLRAAATSAGPTGIRTYVYGADPPPPVARVLLALMAAPLKRGLLEEVRDTPRWLGPLSRISACDDPEAATLETRGTRPRWADWDLKSAESFARAAKLELDLELSRLVRHLRDERRRTGRWPERLPSPIVHACPGRLWEYEATRDGRMRVALSGPPSWRPPEALWLPVAHEE